MHKGILKSKFNPDAPRAVGIPPEASGKAKEQKLYTLNNEMRHLTNVNTIQKRP